MLLRSAQPMVRRAAKRIGLIGAVALVGGCLSPTLPLPPPDLPSNVTNAAEDLWAIQGTCVPGAEVIVVDEATGDGVVFVDLERTGQFNVEIHAKLCDYVTITQTARNEDSAKTGFLVQPIVNGTPVDPSTCGN
jgi:hypothetical protein